MPEDLRATVLIADDDPVNRAVLRLSLEQQGHHVREAENGVALLAELVREPADVVFTDIEMPEMDGYEVLAQRHDTPALRDIPFIVVSAVEEMASIVKCVGLGAEDYLLKPFEPALLNARLSASLEKKRRRDQEAAYLRDVKILADTAALVERGQFDMQPLEELAARGGELGRLATVFGNMAREVRDREEKLRNQLRERGYVFLSYASGDRERIQPIVERLTEAGVTVWLDRQNIHPGASWAAEIVQAIRGCSALLIAVSAGALDSRNVRQEIAIAWKYNRPYVPLILETTAFPDEIEYQLEGWQWVEILAHPSEMWVPPLLDALARFDVASRQ